MTKPNLIALLGSSAICVGLTGAANAEVSALEVWDNWKSYSESYGQKITVGSETASGDTLTLRDVNLSMDFPEGQMSGTLEMIEFRERSDGTVAITMSQDYPLSLSIKPAEGDEVDLGMIIRQSGMSMVASGGDGTISYAYLASEFGVSFDRFYVAGEDIGADIGLTMTDIDGNYSITDGDPRQVTSAMDAGSVNMQFAMQDPDSGANITMSGGSVDISSSSTAQIPAVLDLENPTWVFDGSFSGSGEVQSGKADYTMAVEDGAESFNIAFGSDSSSLGFGMEDGTMSYGGTNKGAQYTISGAQIPLPQVTLGIAESAFNLVMPMKKSDEPREFGFLTKIIGLSVSDDIWGMFDPAQILPRDPATLIVDVAGQMNWLINLADPEEAAAFEASGGTPAELHGVTLNEIKLSIAGAEMNGTGDFTFDNTDLVTFDGMPAPTGAVNLNIIGANGLMDKLVEMGLLPDEQAMGARMMLGLFARPADGPDTLTSTIEVQSNGSVFANGQQLK